MDRFPPIYLHVPFPMQNIRLIYCYLTKLSPTMTLVAKNLIIVQLIEFFAESFESLIHMFIGVLYYLFQRV